MKSKSLRFEDLECRRMLAVITVYQVTDNGNGNIGGSLSWAIGQANALPNDSHSINFSIPDNTDGYISISGSLPAITAKISEYKWL